MRLFNYTYTAQRILNISGGVHALKVFASAYIKAAESSKPPKDQQPVILLLDNDKGGKDFYSFVKSHSGSHCSGLDPYYHVAENLYVVFTPIAVGAESKIEDFFDPAVLATKLNGKSFNPKNEGVDTDTEYGKWVFAQQVVKPSVGSIDFGKFDPILTRLESAIAAHKAHASVP